MLCPSSLGFLLSVELTNTSYQLSCRELIRMRSQGGHYFWEIWTWIELSNISLLTVSTVSFMSLADRTVEGNDINRNLLIATSTMAILQLVCSHYRLLCNFLFVCSSSSHYPYIMVFSFVSSIDFLFAHNVCTFCKICWRSDINFSNIDSLFHRIRITSSGLCIRISSFS